MVKYRQGVKTAMNRLFVIMCAAVAAVSFAEEPPLPARPADRVTPEAKELLKECHRAGRAWKPHTDHICFFPRAQVKYTLHNAYLHRWYERPLYADSGFRSLPAPADGGFREAEWAKTVEMVKWGLMDGLAAVPTQRGREAIVPSSERSDAPLTILWELPYATAADKGIGPWLVAAEKALASPSAFRIDGKVVLTRYPPVWPEELDKMEEFRRILKERFGDKFIVMSYGWFGPRGKVPRDGPVDAAAVERMRECVRAFLRKTDGYLYCGYGQVYAKRYDSTYFRRFVVPVVRSVMAEPEFAGRKYLGLNLHGGHENTYQFSYSIDSTGTRYLREALECAEALRPDFAVCCEWDEQNENTFFRPVVSSGHVIQRIFRHYVNRFARRPQEVLPGDDTTLPNLSLSYRKSLVAGEPLEIEVLNIPDGTFAGKRFRVSVALRDLEGRVVKEFPAQELDVRVCEAAWFNAFASELAKHRVLSPELKVEADGYSRTFSDGFWPIEIRALRNADHKWVRQPLRDIAWGVRGSLEIVSRNADGTCDVRFSASSPDPFASVEIMDGFDTAYAHAGGAQSENFRDDGRVRVRIAVQGAAATGKEYLEQRYFRPKSGKIPFDFGQGMTGVVSVADVAREGAVGYPGKRGTCVVATRWPPTADVPPACGGTEAAGTVRIDPLGDASVFRLRVVDSKHRVWCSRAVSPFVPSGKTRRISVFERDADFASSFEVDAAAAPDLVYVPPSGSGAVLKSNGGRDTWGLLGGGASLVTGTGRGESSYGYVPRGHLTADLPGIDDTAPTVGEDASGRRYMEFGNCRFGNLPKPAVPSFSGFRLSMEVFPEDDSREQGLLCADMSGVRLTLGRGLVPVVVLACGNDMVYRHFKNTEARGPALRKGEWNRVVVVFDQKSVQVLVDGKGGEKVPKSGYQWNQGHSVLGAFADGKGFFAGRIGEIRIEPL